MAKIYLTVPPPIAFMKPLSDPPARMKKQRLLDLGGGQGTHVDTDEDEDPLTFKVFGYRLLNGQPFVSSGEGVGSIVAIRRELDSCPCKGGEVLCFASEDFSRWKESAKKQPGLVTGNGLLLSQIWPFFQALEQASDKEPVVTPPVPAAQIPAEPAQATG